MKKSLRMKFMLLLFALVVGISSSWAQTTYTYKLVTNANQLSDGDKIIIASGENATSTPSSIYAIGTANNGNNRKAASVSVSNNIITTAIDNGNVTTANMNSANDYTNPLEITLVASNSNWNLKEVIKDDAIIYLNGGAKQNNGTSNNNHLKAATTVETATGNLKYNGVWSIAINTTNYKATITNGNNYSIKLNGNIFASYISGSYTDVYIYKKVYSVNYDANGGSGTMTDSDSPYFKDATVTLLDNAFTAPANKTFDCWVVTDGSSNVISVTNNQFTMPSSNVTVTAQWRSSLPASDLAITGSPKTLNFDLYNNNSAQTVAYTTSGTGDVTVDASDYVTTSVNSGTKTITVSPKSIVTPSTQTITVRQAADASHAAGTATFSVNITNSAPSITISGEGITNNAVNLDYDDNDAHTASVAYNNLNNPSPTLGIFSDSDCTVSYEGQDFFADFATNDIEHIEYAFTDANNDPDNVRTVYIRVAVNTVYSNVITITQGAYIPSYDVTFDTDGGSFVTNEAFPSDAETKEAGTYTLPSATKTNYTFAGWYDGDLVYAAGASYTISANVDFIAQWVQGGTIYFGNGSGDITINGTSVSGNDSFGKSWTVSSVFPTATTSFTQNANYSQVGSKSTPATSITFTSTISQSSVTLMSFSANFAGGAGTSLGTVTLKVGDTPVGTGTISGTGSVTVTNTKQVDGTALTVVVDGITASIQCYSISYTFTTSTAPIIGAPSSIDIFSDITNNEFDYGILHPVGGKILTATPTTDWISNINVTDTKVTFDAEDNNSTDDDRIGTIKLSYDGAVSKTVTITQSKKDYATLSFTYDENGVNSNLVTGLTSNLSGGYGSSPKMQFDATGKYLVLHLHTSPSSISYDIQGKTFSGGTFKVQTSSNGIDYDDLATYTTIDGSKKTITHIITDETRFIKWIYTTKSTGNVALGNIKASNQYDVYGTATVASLEPTSSKKCTIYNGGVLTVTGTLENGTAANLIIEDGAQLKFTSTGAKSDVQATVQKNITGYTDDHTGWNFIASPISGSISPNAVTNLLGEQTSNDPETYNYDLYRFNPSEPDNKGWENYHQHNDNENPFLLFNGQGYLYAKSSNTTLSFADAIKPYITENNANRVALAPGWNLVGNPYTFNVYSSKSYYAITTVNDENVVTAVNNASTYIAPCTGIVVKNTGNETDYVYFLDEAGSWSTGNNGNLQMVLAQNVASRGGNTLETLDNAIISFNEGSQLEKFYFGNQNANIYIPQDKEEYAIVSANAFGELPVNFTANQSGEYTLTFNAEDVEMGYLHLIDNMTGANVDLLANPSYTFNANVDDYESRFRLVFSAKDVETTDGNADFAFINDGNIIVAGTGTVRVYDITGRMVASSDNANSVSTVGMTPGVYVLQLVNGTETKTQKIIVK